MARRLPLPNLGPRTRKALQIAGYVVLALVTFVFALQLTFPFDRVKSRIEEALASKYVVTIGEVERGYMPGRVYFNSVSLQTRPSKPDDPVSTMYIDQLEVDLGLFALIGGAASVDIDAKIGGGRIHGNISLSKSETSIDITGSDLQSQMLPMREAIGLPMAGTVEFSFALDLPSEAQKGGKMATNWQNAEGSAEFACPTGCTFGDGKTKLKTKLKNARSQAFAEGGIEFGKVNLTKLLAKIEIKSGQLTLTQFEAPSEDGTLHVDYAMELAPSFDDSVVTGCLRFNGSQGLLQRDAKTFTAISATGAQLGPDKLFHIRLTDKFKDMRRLAQPCGKDVSGKSMDNPSGASKPPSLPDEPVVRGASDAGIPTFTPPTAMTADASVPGTADSAVAVPIPGPDSPGSAAAGSGHGSGIAPPDGHGSAAGSAATSDH